MEGYMLSKDFITQAGELILKNAYDYGTIEQDLKREGFDDKQIMSYIETLTEAYAEIDAIFEDKRSVNQWKRDGYVFISPEGLNEEADLSSEEVYEGLVEMYEAAHEDEEEEEDEKEEGMHEGAHEDDEEEDEEEEISEAPARGQKTKTGSAAAGAAGAAGLAARSAAKKGLTRRKILGRGKTLRGGVVGGAILGAAAGGILYKAIKKAQRSAEAVRLGAAGIKDPAAKADRMYKARIKELNAKKAAIKMATSKALSDPANKGNQKKLIKIKDYGNKQVAKVDAQISNASTLYRKRKK